jgi:hypothetical protein
MEMPDYQEDPQTREVEMSPQHLVNATWKATTLSLLAVVIALVLVLAYVFIGIDVMRKGVDDIKEDNTRLATDVQVVIDDLEQNTIELADQLTEDHLQLVCRDVAAYQEGRAVSDTIVVFLVALENLAADTPIDVEGLGNAIRNLRAIQSERDSTINSCLNGTASQANELLSGSDG